MRGRPWHPCARKDEVAETVVHGAVMALLERPGRRRRGELADAAVGADDTSTPGRRRLLGARPPCARCLRRAAAARSRRFAGLPEAA